MLRDFPFFFSFWDQDLFLFLKEKGIDIVGLRHQSKTDGKSLTYLKFTENWTPGAGFSFRKFEPALLV